jgi:formylglycine-generating enzyme required for sulfatase activity
MMRVVPAYFYLMVFLFSGCGDEHVVHQEEVRQPDTSRMVLIPAGEFEMGSPLGEPNTEKPTQRVVWLDAYYIDKFEVTNAEFERFVKETGYVTDVERRGSGIVWNPVESLNYRISDASDVSWRKPHAWREDRSYYPDECVQSGEI